MLKSSPDDTLSRDIWQLLQDTNEELKKKLFCNPCFAALEWKDARIIKHARSGRPSRVPSQYQGTNNLDKSLL